MNSQAIRASLQDFSVIKTNVEKMQKDFNLSDSVGAFYFFVLDLILELQEDEIRDSITDTKFLLSKGGQSGHDRGIDAIYIDESEVTPKIHLFNFKYVLDFGNTKKNFPGSEIDKITGFINALMQKNEDEKMLDEVNPVLSGKIKEIWDIFESENPDFTFHICANLYLSFEKQEEERFEREIRRHSNFEVKYHLMSELVKRLTKKGKKVVDAKLRGIDKYFFEKSGGDIRALILTIDARDLIRIVLDNDEIRSEVDLEDYNDMKKYDILEDAFEDNVRMYLKQRSRVNRNIKATALSDDSHRIFYYNNGITITCEHFEYAERRSPIIKLKDLQVVNGGQTVHALYEAFLEDSTGFEEIEILCRVYETRNRALSTNIAEYTNSQNPVKTRDIRSIDYVQQRLEKEFLAIGYFYERKRNQYPNKPKDKRLDAEKVGQVLMAFFNKMPSEARGQKALIFAEKYEDVFNDSITSDRILLSYNLFNRIEEEKSRVKAKVLEKTDSFTNEGYSLLYASYYILYILGELASKQGISLEYGNIERIWRLYDLAVELVNRIAKKERKRLESAKEPFEYAPFFKTNRPKKYFEDMLDSGDVDEFILVNLRRKQRK